MLSRRKCSLDLLLLFRFVGSTTHADCTQIEGGRVWAAGCSLIKRALDDRTLVQCAAERDFKRVQYVGVSCCFSYGIVCQLSPSCVRYLVDSGHDPRETNSHGMTALHFAVMKESLQMVKFLVRILLLSLWLRCS
jgi:hypothetical protein